MNSDTRKLLEAVQQGAMSVDEALLAIKKEPFADIGYAKVDMHRGIRQGAAEVIYGAGKTVAQMIGIVGVHAPARPENHSHHPPVAGVGGGDRRRVSPGLSR